MSGAKDLYKLTNFLELKQQNDAAATKEKTLFPHGMSVKDIYPRLESSEPGFLKRDVIRYAKIKRSLY